MIKKGGLSAGGAKGTNHPLGHRSQQTERKGQPR